MIRNYFKIAIRSLWKNKLTSFVNLFGLSVGMTASVFIFLWVQNEMTFDNYYPNKDHIYLITNLDKSNNTWELSPQPMADAVIKEIPEAEQVARMTHGGNLIFRINQKLFSEKNVARVDKGWLNIFKCEFVEGNALAFNQNPFSIILTESIAKKYFGNVSAIGQIIGVDTVNYTVEGVVKDYPLNSSFQFDILMQLDGFLSNPKRLKKRNDWNNSDYITFLQLQPDAKKSFIETKLDDIVYKHSTNHNNKVSLEPLTGMYFRTDIKYSNLPHGDRKTTYIFSLLGLLLLIIACINYVNLTTAKASLRSKEVSVKKIVGAGRVHLFFQFIAESLTISLVSLLVTLIIIKTCLPIFNIITEKNFQLSFTSTALWTVLLGTLFTATLLNGIYPAILLSSFKPLNVFRGRSVLKLRDGFIRKGLVTFQFVLSMILIMATLVMYLQMRFIQTSNPGYNVSQILSIYIPYKSYSSLSDTATKTFFAAIRHELQSQNSVAAVCTGGEEIVNDGDRSGGADWNGHDTTYQPIISRLSVDEDFQKMFQLQLKEGRWFKRGNDDVHNFIINETAEREFNMHKPVIGQQFFWRGDTGRIIGIVKDFNYKSMHEKIGPMVLLYNDESDNFFFVKTVPGNIQKTLSAVGAVWSRFIPNQPFSYNFLDDSFNNLYKSDIKTSTLIFIFSVIAIIISGLGLFALAAFTAEQRTKEIGIRKILGASVQQIAELLSKDFVRLVIIAILVATPVAWLIANKWLMDFAYRINLGAWIFIVAGVLVLLIAILSVSIQAIKAAMANPVKNLRTE